MPYTAASPLEPRVTSVETLTCRRTRVVRRLTIVALLATLASGCVDQPAPTLRNLWFELRPEPWHPVEIESAVRVGPEGDWWVRVRMHDGQRVDDVIRPWSRSQANRPWVMPHSQPLGNHPELRRTPPAGATPVATRGPDVPRLELTPAGNGYVSSGIVLVEVDGEPGDPLGRYAHVPGTDEPRWRGDRLWMRVLLTTPAAVLDAALFVLNVPYYVLWPRGFHT